MVRRFAVSIALIASLFALLVPPALADHGEGHNGETMELSKSEDIADGETITVNLTSFLPGVTATVVTCFNYPAAGPADCELSNYGQFTIAIGDDGTGTIEYPVAHVEGKCDATTPCFIVAGDGIGPSANYAAVEVTFAEGDAAPAEDPATEDEATEEEPAEEEPAEEEPTEEEAAEDEPADEEAAEDDAEDTEDADTDADDDDGGGNGWVLPAIIAVVLLGGAGAFVASRNKK